MSKKILLSFAFLMVFSASFQSGFAQAGSAQLLDLKREKSSKKLFIVLGSEVLISTAMMSGLNAVWYKNYPKSNFHFFNDNGEWLQMDKIGHAMTAYYVGKFGIDVMKWSGMEKRNAALIGGSLGFVFLTGIEVLDGFSSQWGFSYGDFIANAAGSALAISQDLYWNEQRVSLKFSYKPSIFPKYRSKLLGDNFAEKIIKDYNAQTYWLSLNIASFSKRKNGFPKWLNLAIGYGGDGMLGGKINPFTDEFGNVLPSFKRSRQYLLSLDLDLSKVKTEKKALKWLFRSLGFIKIPLPTIEYRQFSGWKLHPFYF